MQIKYISLFSGIGGFELGIGNKAKCVGFSEIDKYAIQIYQKHFNHKNYGDITTIKPTELPDFDLIVGGFPCQSFSIAGKRGGFKDTRGTLFFNIAEIARVKRPRLLLLENVKGLLSHNEGNTFATIIGTLDELGYDCQWQVLNSKNFGVPQNRERVFIIGHLRGTSRPEVFPIGETNQGSIKQTKELREQNSNCLRTNYGNATSNETYIRQLNKPKHSNDRVYSDKGLSPTINTAQGGNRQPFVAMQWRRTEKGKEARKESQKKGKDYTPFSDGHRELIPKKGKPVGALTAQAIAKDSLLGNHSQIRRLTPTECARLQGFPDDWHNGVSDTQAYKCYGNAVTTNVIKEIAKRLLCK